MNKSISYIMAMMAMLMGSVIKSCAGCNYTAASVCQPAGTVLSSTPVDCYWGEGWATLYDMVYTTGDAYVTTAVPVDANHTSGKTGVLNGSTSTTVGIATTTIDPDTCNVTINPSAGTATVTCSPASVADPNSANCYFVERNPGLNSYYSLAML